MTKKVPLILCLVFILTLFSGCRKEISSLEENLERLEDRAENYLEGMDDQLDAYFAASDAPNGTLITKESAEEIALSHAGFTREQVSRLHTEYEIDDRIPLYTVDFYMDGWEYEYEIHGETGQILSYDKDFD